MVVFQRTRRTTKKETKSNVSVGIHWVGGGEEMQKLKEGDWTEKVGEPKGNVVFNSVKLGGKGGGKPTPIRRKRRENGDRLTNGNFPE